MPKDRSFCHRDPTSRLTPYGQGVAKIPLGGGGRTATGAAKVPQVTPVNNDTVIEELISSVDVLVGQVSELNDQVKQAHLDVRKQLSAEQVYMLQEAALVKLAETAIDCSNDTKSATTALSEYLDRVTSALPIGVDDRIAFNSLLSAVESSIALLAASGSLPPSDTTAMIADLCSNLTEKIGPKHFLSLLLDSLGTSFSDGTTADNEESSRPPSLGSLHETINTVLQSHLDLASELTTETQERNAIADEIRELVAQLRASSTNEPEAFAAIIASAESAASDAAQAHLASQLERLQSDSRLVHKELAQLKSDDHALLTSLESLTANLNTVAGMHAALIESLNNAQASPGSFSAALEPVIQQATLPLADVAAGLAQAAAHIHQLEPESADMSALRQMPPMDVHHAGGGYAVFADATINEHIRKWVVAQELEAVQVRTKRAVDHVDASVRAAGVAIGVEGSQEGSVEQVMEKVMGAWTRTVGEVNDVNQEQKKLAEEVLQGLERAVDVERVVRERSNLIDGVGWSPVLGLEDKIVERKRAFVCHGSRFQSR